MEKFIISAISLVPCPINILPRLFPCSCFLKTGDTFTYQAEAKYGYREEDAGMDAPLSLSEPETYTFTVVRQGDKLLMEQFTYPGVSEENRCNTEDWIIS